LQLFFARLSSAVKHIVNGASPKRGFLSHGQLRHELGGALSRCMRKRWARRPACTLHETRGGRSRLICCNFQSCREHYAGSAAITIMAWLLLLVPFVGRAANPLSRFCPAGMMHAGARWRANGPHQWRLRFAASADFLLIGPAWTRTRNQGIMRWSVERPSTLSPHVTYGNSRDFYKATQIA
jgi:hypothetical protein